MVLLTAVTHVLIAGDWLAGSAGYDLGSHGPGLADNCRSAKYKLIIYDTETTGTWPQRVIELAAYAPESNRGFSHLVNPPKHAQVRLPVV